MKNIVLFIDSIGGGGAQKQLIGLAILLKKESFNPTIITYFNDPFYIDAIKDNNIKYINIKNADKKWLRILLVNRQIRRLKPSIVISYLDSPSIISCILKYFGAKWKLIVSERNTSQKKSWREWIKFQLFRAADWVVPNSYSQEQFINSYFKFLSNKVVTITNFVDINYFVSNKTYLANSKITKILVVASIWEPKNTLQFIEALALLKEVNSHFIVSWYGKTPHYHNKYIFECENLIKKLNLDNNIKLYNKTTNILEKYLEADIFCLPSLYEGTPNVICEAISCGLPVVCSRVCDNNIYVKDFVNGFLFNPNDISDIATALQNILNLTNEELQLFSYNSRKIAIERLTEELFINKYIKLFY